MFYYASKLLWIPAQPSNLLVCVLAAGILALLFGRRKLALWLLCPVAAGLVAISLLPVGLWLLLPLENRFPPPAELPPIDGIVVLGGGVDTDVAQHRGVVPFQEDGERIITLVELARRYPQARLVFTGGASLGSTLSEADVMRGFFRAHGLDDRRVIFEDRARNTSENALLSKPLAKPVPGERWLLVTSAFHMPRAVGVFRRAGWPVIPYPVDYRTSGEIGIFKIPDAARRWVEFDQAIRNWIGLVAYWLSGRTSALFPAP